VKSLLSNQSRVIPAMLAAWLLSSHVAASAGSGIDKQWDETLKAGVFALDNNQYWRAEPLLKQAVVEAGTFGFSDCRLAKSLGELGRLYTIRGRFKEAEPYLEEEVQIKRQVLGDENEAVVPAMGELNKFYLNYGTESKAEPLTEDILSIVEGKLATAHAPNTDGKVKFKKGQVLEGWAGEATKQMRDPLIEWAITCDSLGNAYRLKEKYDIAERLYKAALDVKETVLGKEHLSLANSYDSLGTLCSDRKEYKEAESYYRDALNQTERILGSGNPQVWQRLDKLARCLVKDGKPDQAAELYQRALSFWKNDPAPNGENARALFQLGSLYAEQKKYAEAAPILEHALQLAQDVQGPDSIGIVPYLERYAYTLYYLGRKPETDQLRARAATISGVIQ
jgi:tetratricopeptide (TPR) repeat protein